MIEAISDDGLVRYTMAATAQEVFEAWVTPELIEQWWGPDGYSTKVRELDLVEGGKFAFEMIAPNGASSQMTGIYKEIHAPDLLVFEVLEHCNLNLPNGVEPQLDKSLVTVKIDENEISTEVVLSHSPLGSNYKLLANVSWSQSLAKLSKNLLRYGIYE